MSTTTTKPRADYRITFAVLAVGMSSYALLQSMIAPVLPILQHDLNTTQNTVTWVMTAYLLSASVATPILGRVGDAYGKEKMLLVSLGALVVGSVLAALAPTIGVMIIARVIQGVGGGIAPVSFGIIRDEFPRVKVTGAIGALAALLAVGGGLGLVLAGPLEAALGYRWLFWLPGIVTAIAMLAAWAFVPESPVRTPGRINVKTAVLLSAWLVVLLVGVSQAPSWGWGSPRVLGLIALGLVLAVVWVMAEWRSKYPLVDMRMMRLPAVWTANLVSFMFGVGMYASFSFLPALVQTPTSSGYGLGSSITESGLILLPQCIFMFLAGNLAGRLTSRFGPRPVMVFASLIGAVSFAMVAFWHAAVWQLLIATALSGVSFGIAFAGLTAVVVGAVRAEQTGVASGMNANIRTIGGAIGSGVVSSLVTATLLSDGSPAESGYTNGFAVMAGALVLAALASLMIPVVRRRGTLSPLLEAEIEATEAPFMPAGIVGSDASA